MNRLARRRVQKTVSKEVLSNEEIEIIDNLVVNQVKDYEKAENTEKQKKIVKELTKGILLMKKYIKRINRVKKLQQFIKVNNSLLD